MQGIKRLRHVAASRLRRHQAVRPGLLIAVALIVGAGGWYFLRPTSATSYTEAPEAESGVIEGKASSGADDSASGKLKVLFGQSMTPPDSLDTPSKKDIAMQLVSSAENSSLDWKAQYKYLEDIGDGRGYTGGIIGFCSGTGDMLDLIEYYAQLKPDNALAKYIPALQAVNGTDSHDGLGAKFETDWAAAAADPLFERAQNDERDRVYFNPSVSQAKADGLGTLGQFIYYDAAVMHGADAWGGGLPDIRAAALGLAKTPAQGGDETVYLNAFLDKRKAEMLKEAAHEDTSRVDTAQRKFLDEQNFNLDLPLSWTMYGEPFSITAAP